MPQCNTTLEDADVGNEKELSIGITFHHLGLILSAITALIAFTIAMWLIVQHALHYLRPWEQKHIIRILFMIPVYALVSFLSYYFYKHAIYFEVLRDCYEAFAIASFFTLLCHYLAPTLHEQKDFFRSQQPRNWVWPLTWFQKCTGGKEKGMFRVPRSGLTWFNIVFIGVYQYCLVRVCCTILSVITQSFDRYCESSLSPAFAHVWVMVLEAASVTVAMYCLIQFYAQTRNDLAEQRPFLKLLCIKLVIFLSFWQNLFISFLSSSSGPLQPTPYLHYPDIKVGVPSMLLCLEMAIFSVLHIFAFPWRRPYSLNSAKNSDPLHMSGVGYSGGKPEYKGFWYAIWDSFNPWDIIKASARGFRWLFKGRRQRTEDISYKRETNVLGGGNVSNGIDATKLGPVSNVNYARDDRFDTAYHSQLPPNPSPYVSSTLQPPGAAASYYQPGYGQDPSKESFRSLGGGRNEDTSDISDMEDDGMGQGPDYHNPGAYHQRFQGGGHAELDEREDRAGLLGHASAPGYRGIVPGTNDPRYGEGSGSGERHRMRATDGGWV